MQTTISKHRAEMRNGNTVEIQEITRTNVVVRIIRQGGSVVSEHTFNNTPDAIVAFNAHCMAEQDKIIRLQ